MLLVGVNFHIYAVNCRQMLSNHLKCCQLPSNAVNCCQLLSTYLGQLMATLVSASRQTKPLFCLLLSTVVKCGFPLFCQLILCSKQLSPSAIWCQLLSDVVTASVNLSQSAEGNWCPLPSHHPPPSLFLAKSQTLGERHISFVYQDSSTIVHFLFGMDTFNKVTLLYNLINLYNLIKSHYLCHLVLKKYACLFKVWHCHEDTISKYII